MSEMRFLRYLGANDLFRDLDAGILNLLEEELELLHLALV